MLTGRAGIRGLGLLQWLIVAVLLAVGVILLLLAGNNPHGVVGSILREVGIVTLGTVLVALVYEFVLRPEHDRQLLEVVENSLIAKARAYGLSKIDRLDFTALFEQLHSGDELYWLDTYCPDVGKGGVQQAMRDALARGATVRMLVVDPDSFVAHARADEIETRGYGPGVFEEGARTSLRVVQDIQGDLPAAESERLEIRTYSDLPCAPMYVRLRAGQPINGWTSYFLGLPTYESAHFYWDGGAENLHGNASGLGLHAFCKYFVGKWERAVAVELDKS